MSTRLAIQMALLGIVFTMVVIVVVTGSTFGNLLLGIFSGALVGFIMGGSLE